MLTRRGILKVVSAVGISSTVFARALAQEGDGKAELTREMIGAAKWVSGIELTEAEEESLVREVNNLQRQLKALRGFKLDPQRDGPALGLQTLAGSTGSGSPRIRGAWPLNNAAIALPKTDEDIAFLSVTELGKMIRSRQISSVELTKLYFERLRRFQPLLNCTVNLTEDLAMQQAERADRELAAGRYRGPLHGIPWGAKDLISVPGYPTTWGIPIFKDRVLNETATVAQRLDEAGAVLVAKLSLGAIAMGDRWFNGTTKNPWNPAQGSSGSSAGSAAATAAGLVGFAIGSETLGSILTPSTRCGSHGLRPTFGRVSRAGCMPLSWSMDKIGPLARSVNDLGLVLAAIYGPDDKDPTVVDRPFRWPPLSPIDFRSLRVGVVPSRRDSSTPDSSLEILRGLHCQIVEVELPKGYPLMSLTKIIDAEGAAVFDDLLRAGQTEGWNTWTKSFQTAQFITAVDYLRMQRIRRRLMIDFEEAIKDVDILWNANDLAYTNFTGHPSLVMPYQYREVGETFVPQVVVITGKLFAEEMILAVAEAFARLLPSERPRPPLEQFLAKASSSSEQN